ncbi:MAG: HlyD family efflux transporter periplasmic adaptor subunit [Caulobacteraceae bacterium]|nr:HlyD family efflux transporter periplasmic adaptor subunit [Caulobacter sp.]
MPDDASRPPSAASITQPGAGPALGPDPAAAAAVRGGRTRKRLFTILGVVVVLAAVLFGLWYVFIGSREVSTDDAYVGADVAQITPQVGGQVAQVLVSDTQAVKAGQVLVTLDPADTRAALDQARAQYGQAIRRVRQDLATNDQLEAQIAARNADYLRAKAQLVAGQSEVDRTRIDLQRRQRLAQSGAVSGEELTTAKNAYATAVANLDATKAAGVQSQANIKAAQGQLAAQQALTAGADVDDNPEVQAAKAMLDAAQLNFDRTTIRAPFDGVVAQRNVQVGQRVGVGANLMTVVPVDKVYVNANFKEVQLRKVRPGQPADVTADLYGGHVVYHGKVVGFSGGTGAAFAVIPAQNATGNWIKVVQRLPVRIWLPPAELRAHPLRVGLSTTVKVDVADAGSGNALSAPSQHPGA